MYLGESKISGGEGGGVRGTSKVKKAQIFFPADQLFKLEGTLTGCIVLPCNEWGKQADDIQKRTCHNSKPFLGVSYSKATACVGVL